MITIIHDTNSAFYSVYRPIVIKGYDNDSDTAFLRGELLVETPMLSGNYVTTGSIINGYESSDNTNIYEFNIMEHCRPFVGKGFCPILSSGVWYAAGAFESRRFKLDIWPVKYSPGFHGQLFDEVNNLVSTKDFTAIATITTDEYSLNHQDDFTTVDRLVLGYNNPSFNPNSHQPLTNAPNNHTANGLNGKAHQTININDFPCDSIYQPVSFTATHTRLSLIVLVRNKSTQVWTLSYIPIANNVGIGGELVRIPLHPATLELLYMLATGQPLNKLIDASGNLIADAFFILPVLTNASGQLSIRWADWKSYSLTNDNNNGKCQHKKFVFQNMKGGFDWFNCYGTQSKSVSVSGSTYQNHTTSNLRGLHVEQKLWNNRKDTYKVITQPLSTEEAEWIQELVSSPKVWVQEKMKDNESSLGDNYLRPIIINNSDFQIHTTEDNIHFIEFSYTLSNPVSTQRG
tara:strand:- start:1025 stop:2401 length:1377 start_codon:yes stop_codon:yes gene_type:complete